MNNSSVYKRLKDVESSDATMSDPHPLVLSHGEGAFLWDVQGSQYIDLCAGFGSLSLGHGHPRLKATLAKASLYQGMGDVYGSLAKTECLELLSSLLPAELSRGAFAVTGSQAVEMAVKSACLATGGSGIICFSGGYHGLDLGVLPLAAREDFRDPFRSLFKEENVERLSYGCELSSLEAALQAFKARSIKPACVIVEPILGRGGAITPPEGWLQKLSDFCQEHGVLFILDEILTGSGRTGAFSKAHSVPCDLVCLGKAMGGGFPISVCFGRDSVMKHWDKGQDESLHTGTFFGHPLMCELSKETLLEISEESLGERSSEIGSKIRKFIEEQLGEFSEFKMVRGEGLLIGLEFHTEGFAVKLMKDLRKKGVIAIPCGEKGKTLSLTPALNIELSLLEESILKIKECLQAS